MYRLDWRLTPPGQGFGAPHGLDLPLMTPGDREHDEVILAAATRDAAALAAVIEQMRDALARFACGDEPWPAYELERRSTFLFDDRCRTVEDPDGELRRVWDGPAGR